MKALLDTCVIMDFLQNREPFAQNAKKIMQAAAMDLFTGCITAKSATDIYYLTHRCTYSDKDYADSIVTVYTPKEFIEILEKDE